MSNDTYLTIESNELKHIRLFSFVIFRVVSYDDIWVIYCTIGLFAFAQDKYILQAICQGFYPATENQKLQMFGFGIAMHVYLLRVNLKLIGIDKVSIHKKMISCKVGNYVRFTIKILQSCIYYNAHDYFNQQQWDDKAYSYIIIFCRILMSIILSKMCYKNSLKGIEYQKPKDLTRASSSYKSLISTTSPNPQYFNIQQHNSKVTQTHINTLCAYRSTLFHQLNCLISQSRLQQQQLKSLHQKMTEAQQRLFQNYDLLHKQLKQCKNKLQLAEKQKEVTEIRNLSDVRVMEQIVQQKQRLIKTSNQLRKQQRCLQIEVDQINKVIISVQKQNHKKVSEIGICTQQAAQLVEKIAKLQIAEQQLIHQTQETHKLIKQKSSKVKQLDLLINKNINSTKPALRNQLKQLNQTKQILIQTLGDFSCQFSNITSQLQAIEQEKHCLQLQQQEVGYILQVAKRDLQMQRKSMKHQEDSLAAQKKKKKEYANNLQQLKQYKQNLMKSNKELEQLLKSFKSRDVSEAEELLKKLYMEKNMKEGLDYQQKQLQDFQIQGIRNQSQANIINKIYNIQQNSYPTQIESNNPKERYRNTLINQNIKIASKQNLIRTGAEKQRQKDKNQRLQMQKYILIEAKTQQQVFRVDQKQEDLNNRIQIRNSKRSKINDKHNSTSSTMQSHKNNGFIPRDISEIIDKYCTKPMGVEKEKEKSIGKGDESSLFQKYRQLQKQNVESMVSNQNCRFLESKPYKYSMVNWRAIKSYMNQDCPGSINLN